MPFAAAEATKRREKSASTGRVPTRKRPRSASPSGVLTRALRARIRSQGLSTPRLTAASKHPPPETSRYANPALSRISASRSCSATGTRPASGSWPSRRIVVSASDGTRGAYREARRRLGAGDVALLARVDLEAVADVDEERHLDHAARLERRGLRHVRNRVALHAGLGLDDRQLHRRRHLYARRLAVDGEHLHRCVRLHKGELVLELGARYGEL